MTERAANYGRARPWLRSPGPAPPPPACPRLVPDALARQGQAGLGGKDGPWYTCGSSEARPRPPRPFSELEAALITREGETEARRGPRLGHCHTASLYLQPATLCIRCPPLVFLARALR